MNAQNSAVKIEKKKVFTKKLSAKERFMKLPWQFKSDILKNGAKAFGNEFNEKHAMFEAVFTGYLIGIESFSLDSKTNNFTSTIIARFIESGFQFSGNKHLTLIDINGLKWVNDNLGHLSGDLYIEKIAENINSHISHLNDSEGLEESGCIFTDIAVRNIAIRYGGDEILLITNKEISDATLEFLSSSPIRLDENTIKGGHVGCFSFGKHSFENKNSYNNAISIADQKMYKYKSKFYDKNNLDRRMV